MMTPSQSQQLINQLLGAGGSSQGRDECSLFSQSSIKRKLDGLVKNDRGSQRLSNSIYSCAPQNLSGNGDIRERMKKGSDFSVDPARTAKQNLAPHLIFSPMISAKPHVRNSDQGSYTGMEALPSFVGGGDSPSPAQTGEVQHSSINPRSRLLSLLDNSQGKASSNDWKEISEDRFNFVRPVPSKKPTKPQSNLVLRNPDLKILPRPVIPQEFPQSENATTGNVISNIGTDLLSLSAQPSSRANVDDGRLKPGCGMFGAGLVDWRSVSGREEGELPCKARRTADPLQSPPYCRSPPATAPQPATAAPSWETQTAAAPSWETQTAALPPCVDSRADPLSAQPGNSSKPPLEESRLKAVTAVPAEYRALFDFSHFNEVQSEMLDDIQTDLPVVVAAPTG